jgi:CheY-like chemotaxis protein
MKPAWNINRLSVSLAIFGLLVASVGCDSPLMSLRSILSGRAITTASNYLFATIVAADNSDQQSSDDAQTAAKPTAEELVADWQKPEFALFVSGRQHGYIEPCGCTGLENQKGGLMRRHSAQKVLLNRGWDLVSIDAGNQIRRFGQQPTIKLRKTFESLCQIMNYSVIGIGPDDLKTPSIDIVQSIFDVQQPTNAFTCANVVIEDIDDARTMLATLLRLGGHVVHACGDGESGVEAIVQNCPDVALVDIGLPGIDGYEVARRVRGDSRCQSTYMVALTGYGQPSDVQQAQDAGFDTHMVKPIDPDRINELMISLSARNNAS